MEGVSTAWSIEIQDSPEPLNQIANGHQDDYAGSAEDGTSAVTMFEQTIQDPKRDTTIARPAGAINGTKIEIESSDMQQFLSAELDHLEQLRAEDEKERANQQVPQLEMSPMDNEGKVKEHVGPIQTNVGGIQANVGGIQVDADDMVKKLRVSTNHTSSANGLLISFQDREASRTQRKEGIPANPGDGKAQNQALANFFAGLVKKPGTSPRGSPSA